ncbi:hypothetical protein VWY34_14395 [Phaeobacter sp. JH20_02]|uniref:hypothetical protein n=1 Tax=unclassified Phaeobacter TaxID=2621772 RepID=UPI003A868D89
MEAQDFIHHARAETMLEDFARLRKAIRTDHDIEAADRALDKCERWFACINPNPKEYALNKEVERLRDICRMALPLIRAANLEEVTETRDWHEIESRIAAALAKENT